MFNDRTGYDFLALSQDLSGAGELRTSQVFDFEFKNVEKLHESYNGMNVKLRYFVKATISRRMSSIQCEKPIWVNSYKIPAQASDSLKMEVGIEDCLHIEFEYNKSL